MSEPALPSIGERIRWMIRERLEVTQAEFARRLGVHAAQLSRWITRPEHPPSEPYLERMAELGGVSLAWLRYGGGGSVPRAGDELAAEDLLLHFEGVVRRMGGNGVAPEELKLRKLDVVEGLVRLYTAQGSVPGWVHDLRGRIAADAL